MAALSKRRSLLGGVIALALSCSTVPVGSEEQREEFATLELRSPDHEFDFRGCELVVKTPSSRQTIS